MTMTLFTPASAMASITRIVPDTALYANHQWLEIRRVLLRQETNRQDNLHTRGTGQGRRDVDHGIDSYEKKNMGTMSAYRGLHAVV